MDAPSVKLLKPSTSHQRVFIKPSVSWSHNSLNLLRVNQSEMLFKKQVFYEQPPFSLRLPRTLISLHRKASDLLLQKKLAVAYDGGKKTKDGW